VHLDCILRTRFLPAADRPCERLPKAYAPVRGERSADHRRILPGNGIGGTCRGRGYRSLSPAFLGAVIAGHLLATAACVWLDRNGLHASGWVLALVPVPASWIFLVVTANSVYAVLTGAAAWVCLIALAARLDRRETVTADDLDFSLRFAGWSDSMAVCLVPLLLQ
jgi:hypothetical protein